MCTLQTLSSRPFLLNCRNYANWAWAISICTCKTQTFQPGLQTGFHLSWHAWILFEKVPHRLSLLFSRNCLFRSLADQLEGDHNRHVQVRRNTVHFMRNNREDFEPFHDGENTFNEYCKYQVFLQSKQEKRTTCF